MSASASPIKTDGRKEARFSLLTRTPKGKRMFASSGWQSYFARSDVSEVENYRDEDTASARGWYEGFGYANASIGVPYRAPGPEAHSVWRPRIRMLPGAGGFPITSHGVHIDPMFHDGVAGMVVEKEPGSFDGAITINTRRLEDGPHRLVVITHARRIRPNDGVLDGTNTGVLSVPFFVRNSLFFLCTSKRPANRRRFTLRLRLRVKVRVRCLWPGKLRFAEAETGRSHQLA
jgi:hypothetical protein